MEPPQSNITLPPKAPLNRNNPLAAAPAEHKKAFTDEEAQALLDINNLGSKETAKHSYKFLVFTILLVIVLIGLSLFLDIRNHVKSASANSSASSSSSASKSPFTSTTGGSSTGSINSEVKYCSNPINANLVC